MTARQDARLGSRTADGVRWSFETQRAPNVGEILQTARERKGLDLARAERDTKIRARHLVALEAGDLSALPAQVYAKGFLRNYSSYLELDADEMLARWRREIAQPAAGEGVKVKPPPQPISAPSSGFKLTSGLLVALILAAIVVGFVGYVALQVVRFTQNPELTLSGPSIRQLQPGATRVVLSGSGTPDAEVRATGADELVRVTTAGSRGSWNLDLPVTKGRNDFTIVSTDPETARESEPLLVIATVPVVDSSQTGVAPALPEGADTSGLSASPSAVIGLTSPTKGVKARNGKFTVEGTTDADRVLVSFQWRGSEAKAKPGPEPVELPVEEGAFSGTFRLPKGRWHISVTAAVDGGAPAIATVAVKSLFDKAVITVSAVDGQTRVKLTDTEDEVIAEGIQLAPGESRTFKSASDVLLRVGNAQAAHVTVDGVEYGAMGNKPEARTWLISQDQKPTPIR